MEQKEIVFTIMKTKTINTFTTIIQTIQIDIAQI